MLIFPYPTYCRVRAKKGFFAALIIILQMSQIPTLFKLIPSGCTVIYAFSSACLLAYQMTNIRLIRPTVLLPFWRMSQLTQATGLNSIPSQLQVLSLHSTLTINFHDLKPQTLLPGTNPPENPTLNISVSGHKLFYF